MSVRQQLELLHEPLKPTKERRPDSGCYRDLYGPTAGALGKAADRCAEVIGEVKPGETIHVVSHGEWSTDHVICHLVDQIGPAHFLFSTWSINEDNASRLAKATEQGLLLSMRGLIDWRMKIRKPQAVSILHHAVGRERFRLGHTHAKVYLLDFGHRAISFVGSPNFTSNPRIEASVLTDSREVHDFHADWLNRSLANADPFDAKKSTQARKGSRR